MLRTLLNLPPVVAVGLLLLPVLIMGVLATRLKRDRLRQIIQGVLISYITVLLMLAAGEVVLRYGYADSGWEPTLAHQNWRDRYWQTNSAGFRDREWQATDWQDKTVVMVTGDSFAAGWGVSDPADRFSDVLGAHLGDDYYVMNLALPGTATRQQLGFIQDNQPPQPDIVILQYFLNDIEYAAASLSRFWEGNFLGDIPSLIQQSHLLNFLFWQIYPVLSPVDMTFEGSYWHWQYESYDNYMVWDVHQREINDFIAYVDSIDAELYVVMFPNMRDPVGSIAYIDRVKFLFEDAGYGDNVLTLYNDVATWDPADAMASARDAHPSAAFHRYVGERMVDLFFSPAVSE